ncbi:hypothetical protein LTSEINV_4286 [Salmonella enterica subsp. enterica serovar Inverness str. R8-3668]|uniref:Uncharacterized protein n=1 Tax=Salmonella enterica subsp. enterica serovar Inverness str. R8-3668 TaxID=913075 RepID=G5NH84_SALET|nr:hypothetical protein LTSEINV_4286 [Salmonella enterica subsp. enterica serovar Inverness str. R8-3668]
MLMVRHFYECRWRSFKIFFNVDGVVLKYFKIFFETLNEVGRAIITTF